VAKWLVCEANDETSKSGKNRMVVIAITKTTINTEGTALLIRLARIASICQCLFPSAQTPSQLMVTHLTKTFEVMFGAVPDIHR
jgi:hypothetical protein